MSYLGKLIVNAFAVLLTAYLLPGVEVASFLSAVIVALILSLLNTFVKPLLIILTIPLTIMSLGLFLIVINAIIIFIADDLVSGFKVKSFIWAILFSFVLSLFNSLFLGKDKKESNKKDNF